MSSSLRYTMVLSVLMFLPFGWHFGTVLGFWGDAPETRADLFWRLGIIVTAFIICSIIVAIVSASLNKDDDMVPDEREDIVLQKAERNGYFALSSAIMLVIWFAFAPMNAMDVANALLLSVCFAEAVKIISGVIYLRLGV